MLEDWGAVGTDGGAAEWSGPRASGLGMLARGAFLHCPRCGQRGVVKRWFKTPPPCSRCGLDFNPDGDAAVGWIIVNLGLTEVLFVGGAGLALTVTWPNVPWTGLTVGAVLANLAIPLLLHPFSRTIWAGIWLLLHRMDG